MINDTLYEAANAIDNELHKHPDRYTHHERIMEVRDAMEKLRKQIDKELGVWETGH